MANRVNPNNAQEKGKATDNPYKVKSDQGFSWIAANIKFNVCSCYKEVAPMKPALKTTPKSRQTKPEDLGEKRCQCGYMREEHDPQAVTRGTRLPQGYGLWSPYEDTEKRATDAYGTILFPSVKSEESKHEAQYVRISPDTPYKDIVGLFKDGWMLPNPAMIISVLGSNPEVSLPEKSIQLLSQSLARIAVKTGTWLVTNGNNDGVAKIIAQGHADYYADRGAETSQKKVPLIGVTTYGMLANPRILEQATDEGVPAVFPPLSFEGGTQNINLINLQNNHNCFLLCDNGTYMKPDQDLELRLKIIDAMSKYSPTQDDSGSGNKRSSRRLDFKTRRAPVLNLMVGGNLACLNGMLMGLQYSMPCLVVQNSGGAADFLDAIIRKLPVRKRINLEDDSDRAILLRKLFTECSSNPFLRQMKATLKADQWSEFAEQVLDIVQFKHLISFIDLSGSRSTSMSDVEDQILSRAMTGKMSAFHRVELALKLNKDASTSVMREAFEKLSSEETGVLMTMAMVKDRPKFVVNFIKHSGISLKSFLTVERLLTLYRRSPADGIFNKVFQKEMGFGVDLALLKDIGLFLSRILNSSYNIDVGGHPTSGPERHLFLFSLLNLKEKAMQYYWDESVGGSGAALLACRYLRAVASHPVLDDEPEAQKRLLVLSEDFEQKAIDVIKVCSADNEVRTLKLLTYKQSIWFSNDVIEVADQSDSEKFIACQEVQNALEWKWLGRMSPSNSKFIVYLSILLPFLIFLLKYESDPEASERETSMRDTVDMGKLKPKRKRVVWYKKILHFYTSPLVKMLSYYTSFLLFLVLFAYVILYEQQLDLRKFAPFDFGTNGNFGELLLMVYIITLMVEELRQMYFSSSDPILKNLAMYFGSIWNWIDVTAIVLFLPAMVMRWFFYENDDTESNGNLQILARSLYIFSLLFFMIRMIHCLSLSETIGPKILMLSKLIGDVVFFIVCLTVFIFSFGTAINAFLYPRMGRESENSNFVSKAVRSIVDHTYWPVFGDPFEVTKEMGVRGACDPADNPYRTCQNSKTYEFLATAVYAIYIFLTNIVLVNLLIAMMVFSFNQVRKDAENEYKVEKFRFQKEFYNKPAIPMPFSFVAVLYRVAVFIYQKSTGKSHKQISAAIYMWERQNKRDQLQQRQNEMMMSLSTAARLSRVESRVDYLVSKIEGNEASSSSTLSLMETLITMQRSLNDVSILVSTMTPPNLASGRNKKDNQRYLKAYTNIQLRTTGGSSSSEDEEDTSGVYSADQVSVVKSKSSKSGKSSSKKSAASSASGPKVRSRSSSRHKQQQQLRSIGIGRTPQSVTEASVSTSSSSVSDEDAESTDVVDQQQLQIQNQQLQEQLQEYQQQLELQKPQREPTPERQPTPQSIAESMKSVHNILTARYDKDGRPILVPVNYDDLKRKMGEADEPEIPRPIINTGEVETQTDDEGWDTEETVMSSDAEAAIARQEAMLEKLLANQGQTNESMKERMLEAQEQLTKLTEQLDATSKNKQDLDGRLKRLDDRLERALTTLETYQVEEQTKGAPPSGQMGGAATGPASVKSQQEERGGSRPGSRHAKSRKISSSGIARQRPLSGGYMATYEEDSRLGQAADDIESKPSEYNDYTEGHEEGATGSDYGQPIFTDMEYERQSAISQLPPGDQVSLQSYNRYEAGRSQLKLPDNGDKDLDKISMRSQRSQKSVTSSRSRDQRELQPPVDPEQTSLRSQRSAKSGTQERLGTSKLQTNVEMASQGKSSPARSEAESERPKSQSSQRPARQISIDVEGSEDSKFPEIDQDQEIESVQDRNLQVTQREAEDGDDSRTTELI